MSDAVVTSRGLDFWYGTFHALKNITIDIERSRVTALIGPSGCGKSTLLRVFNRMCDQVPGARLAGSLQVLGRELAGKSCDVTGLRREVGMVFQQPNPFPMSIFDNLVFGLRLAGTNDRETLERAVETSLEAVGLWGALKDRLHAPAIGLSADFQQRLCIARAVVIRPSILLMDEPCSSLDPVATQHIEELILRLKHEYTIIIVTHSMQQAARISDHTGYMLLGELVEFDATATIFRQPRDKRTEDYISGKFG
ncbi:MAG TPA: phosphate ABC transporter ATP-binding protein PstB [Candidatus Ozemobacteraceae bacterium]|nr:phosphate ABC transporter ATP-binding protein PstB [Candidatus Ozemobacteraceae bacterium]